MTGRPCPICGADVAENPRYPRRLCAACAARAVSEDGRPLVFANADMSGGFEARYADTGARRDSAVCFVDGVRCRAGEARFGGIVIEPDAPPAAG
jgi:hypothetical protein